jgi:hypothetical protein
LNEIKKCSLSLNQGTVRLLVTLPKPLKDFTFETVVKKSRTDLIIHISLHNFTLLFSDNDFSLVKSFYEAM